MELFRGDARCLKVNAAGSGFRVTRNGRPMRLWLRYVPQNARGHFLPWARRPGLWLFMQSLPLPKVLANKYQLRCSGSLADLLVSVRTRCVSGQTTTQLRSQCSTHLYLAMAYPKHSVSVPIVIYNRTLVNTTIYPAFLDNALPPPNMPGRGEAPMIGLPAAPRALSELSWFLPSVPGTI